MKRKLVLLFALTVISSVSISQTESRDGFSPYVDAGGNISLPEKYRDSWAHLGTYFVIGNSQDAHSMHMVYTEKRYLDSYNETGEWPDGAVLVKEVMRTRGAQLTTGASNWATEPDVWFVMVKDKQRRFPDNHCGERDGAGRSLSPTYRIVRWQRATNKTVSGATFPPKQPISSTFRATRPFKTGPEQWPRILVEGR